MKLYMTMKVEGFDGGYADAKIEIDDNLLQHLLRRPVLGRNTLAARFIADEVRAYIEGMVLKNIEVGAIHLP